ncbi:hypothetical protein PAXRUDRAFT_828066 [Paxillus rubicundulus Ve08.2h10]|uniref:Uncharacterized protein n=1 Tax=Paxillus rubicundulus Ve08.2h10 TaxID=930991 RepID=A0A0D0DB47_9AGAM|nr:hypothetical protein PAXRUDRAFT_828066 [Paxillus rubicundulus Ve08.2h10]
MADFFQGLDPGKLVLGGTVLSFITSPFTAPVYNLPIFLFGTIVQESSDAVQSLKVFSGLLSASIIFDIIWVLKNEQSSIVGLLTFLLWLLKFPTAAASLAALRQRGSQFMGLPTDISGPTVWSMPGGFTSSGREGYQTVDDEPRAPPPKLNIAAPVPQPALGIHPGGYQNA